MVTRNVFVLGLDDFQREQLETVRNGSEYAIHPLLDLETLITADSYDFHELLRRARRELEECAGSVDAIIAHWDFPSSVLGPMLSRELGLPGPSLESLLACEHKYWSRTAQEKSIPQYTPRFSVFDPFDDDALDSIDVPFPFFVKPVKGHSSQLSFKVTDADHFADVRTRLREGIGRMATPFDQAMELADVPEHVKGVSAGMCLAEQVVDGVQAAPEGSMFDGEYHVHGVVDQPPDDNGGWSRIDYPSGLPVDVQNRMIENTEAHLRHIGFDNGCFNAEYMWDEDTDTLWLVEVNTRISQSHSDLFAKVDGMSNHEIALNVAMGVPPSLPSHSGPFSLATKIMMTHGDDGVVTRVPSEDEIDRLRDQFPETRVHVKVEPGDRLAELANQAGSHYTVAEIYLGAETRDGLIEGERVCNKILGFEYDPVDDS